jgi:hypothetical protein
MRGGPQIVSRLRAAALVLVAVGVAACWGPAEGAPPTDLPKPTIIVGTDADGVVHHAPADWPAAAGPWNGRAARFLAAGRKLVFESYRADIRGGSIAIPLAAAGPPALARTFVAGPGTGTIDATGTTVLYVANADGSDPSCLGCADVRDGENGVRIYRRAPSPTGAVGLAQRRPGAAVYANQNKDVAAWSPDGRWIIASVEMPRHALAHTYGAGEIAMFNDIWAISADGKTWVQLTDFASGWRYVYPSTPLPVPSADRLRCPTGAQYATAAAPHPFDAYACSAPGQPPPTIGVMRPTVSPVAGADGAPVAWAERVGLDARYTWGGALQLALADLVIADGLPALVRYRRNLTPTPAHPDGSDLWSNPGGHQVVGAGYEAWSFSDDGRRLGFASDVFLSTSDPGLKPTISPISEAFTDVGIWSLQAPAALLDLTAFDPVVYNYRPNGAPGAAGHLGHWEEPSVFVDDAAGRRLVAFGGSADLDPPWDPRRNAATFGLETWLVPEDRSSPAVRLTYFCDPSHRAWAYPTAFDRARQTLFLSVAFHPAVGSNPIGEIFELPLPRSH